METIANSLSETNFNHKVKSWFDELVEQIRVDQLMIETETAPKDKQRMYKSLILGQETEVVAMSRASSSMYFIKNLLLDYINELNNYKNKPLNLALDLSDAKVLVWAEIEDGDEDTEDALILSEAKANAKYSIYGFHVSSTIVEKGDSMSIPPHYHKVSI